MKLIPPVLAALALAAGYAGWTNEEHAAFNEALGHAGCDMQQ